MMFSWGLGIDPKKYRPGVRTNSLVSCYDIKKEIDPPLVVTTNQKKNEPEENNSTLLGDLTNGSEVRPLSRLNYQLIVKERRRKKMHR